jgi:diguanylate cyclase (GGDEF)-like protein
MPTAGGDALLMFADEEPTPDTEAPAFWRLLVVDDEPDVHRATLFALSDVKILGRDLQFLHAYSASEAAELLQREKDIAVVLLDVVMEREDAGLALVRTIREDLKLADLRIILRTGQPGYAPEIETIHDYDINDYKTKSELTRTKLFASVTSSLRAYKQIQALDQLAFYDRLSRLPNRNRFIALIDECASHEKEGEFVIAIVDIDDFAEINDALGHQQGDRLLQAVAERLSWSLGADTTVARLGGDTFGVLGAEARVNPEALLGLFREPFKVQDDVMVVSATVGFKRLTDTAHAGRDSLKDANIALKRAKKTRRGQHAFFTDEMGAEIRERVRLLQGLRSAVDSDRLFIVYQPQINLGTGRLVGVEALLRWRNHDGRLVPPDRFIPLAEWSGLIISIGDWVLRMACHELKQLNAIGLKDLRMSVNVSHNQFRHPDFLAKLSAALADTGVNPACVELEITESIAMEDPDFIVELLARVKKTGVSIAIDDFGTGYSSLSRLRQLPVDRLKIDRAFVAELSRSVESGHIAAMVVELGRNLKLTVIAEGIETEVEAQALRGLGCHEGQGYLYARPMEPADLRAWIAARDEVR